MQPLSIWGQMGKERDKKRDITPIREVFVAHQAGIGSIIYFPSGGFDEKNGSLNSRFVRADPVARI